MHVLDLFSGIGGFSLGLERAGLRTVAFCESDVFCRRVLRKHWPDVVVYDDVRLLTETRLAADSHRWRQPQLAQCDGKSQHAGASQRNDVERLDIDVICGGFPCQDISIAGKGAGIQGERSGLWKEFARIIGEVRPQYVIVENVSALLSRGLGDVLGDLAALGYDAEWHCIPACALGAPHRRDRIWIVAYPAGDVAQTAAAAQREGHQRQRLRDAADNGSQDVADAASARQSQPERAGATLLHRETLEFAGSQCGGRNHWLIEPDLGRVAHAVPARMHRLKALGNALVPQIAQLIGRAISS